MIGTNDVEGVSLQNPLRYPTRTHKRLVTHYVVRDTTQDPAAAVRVLGRKQLGLALFLRFPLTRQFSRPTNHSVDN